MAQLGDWEWLLRCLARAWSVEYIPRTLIRYRQHEASVSTLSFRMDPDISESLEVMERLGDVSLMRMVARRRGRAVSDPSEARE